MIDNVDFHNLEVQKYWSFPKSYKKDAKEETRNMIFSGDYLGSRKMDGSFYKFIKNDDGSMELLGRNKSVNGDYLNKIDWVPHLNSFFEKIPNGTCLLGELYFPEKEGSSNVTTIMGCLKEKAISRQEKGDKLYYYIFDVLAYDGKSLYLENIEDRITYLNDILIIRNTFYTPEIKIADYYEGKELWNYLQKVLMNGGEGIVITKKGTCYQPGKRPARQTLKIKKELQETIDCIFTGRFTAPTRLYSGKEIEKWQYWESILNGEKMEGDYYSEYCKGKTIEPVTKPYFYGWAGSLEIGLVKEDKVIPIGLLSGLSDEIKSDPLKYKGRVIEITAMEILPTGRLRHAKMISFRDDLTIKDATWEKVFHE